MAVEDLIQKINDISIRYGLKVVYLDHSDITLIARIRVASDIFIQIYVNTKKEKINMAIITGSERIYGVDKEGGFYHEHPFENPSLHVKTNQIEIEDFVIKSLDLLKKINLI